MTITIDKGVPMPDATPRGRPTEFPFATMESLDSFIYPRRDRTLEATHKAALARCRYQERTDGRRYDVHIVSDRDGKAVVRVWRVE
jgi:hypothetical protein